jgi:hypothetical protein
MILKNLQSITENLHSAILDRDWDKVSACYESLSGETCLPPKENEGVNPDLLKLMSQMQTILSSSRTEKKRTPKSASQKKADRVITQREPETSSANKFNPNDFADKVLDKNESRINDNVKPPVARSRKQYKPVSITCESCNKSFDVNPLFAREDYKCDRCLLKK